MFNQGVYSFLDKNYNCSVLKIKLTYFIKYNIWYIHISNMGKVYVHQIILHTFAISCCIRSRASFRASFFCCLTASLAILTICLYKSRVLSNVWRTSSYLATAVFWSEFSSLPFFCKSLYDSSLPYSWKNILTYLLNSIFKIAKYVNILFYLSIIIYLIS